MENRAVRLVKISLARHTLKLTPGLATGMAVGADIAQAEPALVGSNRDRDRNAQTYRRCACGHG